MKTRDESRYLNERQAAFYLGLAPITLWKRRKKYEAAVAAGDEAEAARVRKMLIPHSRIGRNVVYDRHELDAYVSDHRVDLDAARAQGEKARRRGSDVQAM